MNILGEIINNNAIAVPVLAWFVAQLIKVLTKLIKDKKFDFFLFVSSGGMPSSHTSFTVSLAVVIGKNYGWGSGIFGLAVAFALVVMYDAAGVRRAVGKQAKVLNKLIHSHMDRLQLEKKLKELVGHTPLEVFMGALLGIVIALIMG